MRKGRLSQSAAELARRYNESVSFDWRLYRYDIAGSIAQAAALARAGIITAGEREQIENELREIERRSSPANSNEIVGDLVLHSIQKGVPPDQIAVAEMKSFRHTSTMM
jgi:hypothetical protein